MTVDQLGAWGDFIGGIAVLAGLVFVGIQLLGANREARAATIQASLEMQTQVDSELAKYPDTWEKVISNSAFDTDAEYRRAIILFNLIMTTMENRYHQYQAGYLEEKSWGASLEAMRRTLSRNISNDWRASDGASTHSADFLNLIDSIHKDASNIDSV